MKKKARYDFKSDSSDYHKGYSDGMKAAFEESELDAYYTGVGYGKKQAGDKHIGFNNDEERRQFERGMQRKDEHFRAYHTKPLAWWQKLFGFKRSRRDTINLTNKRREARKRVKRTSGKRRKNTNRYRRKTR